MIKCLLFWCLFFLFCFVHNNSSPTQFVRKHRPLLYQEKINVMYKQHAIHLWGTYDRKRIENHLDCFEWHVSAWAYALSHSNRSNQSLPNDSIKTAHWFRWRRANYVERVQSLKCLYYYYRMQFNRHQCMQTIRTV